MSKPTAESNSEASSRWPTPLVCRIRMALLTAKPARVPVKMSRAETPHLTGGRPGSPVIDMTPLNACIKAS
ncbi:Uncharacterised protein [Bordetella pertussis]|nr:Uncharacterised protein [Bordetella pertussis]CFO32212.1 Uncharacterised protein [Bordetella pertussis]CFW46218.1 Uncharacterised protein [Bordetella pertussis]CPJ82166.1 Uncharacterised protein [Bordetella pertussis]CPK80240.1 Uncharacterised protein [Bordetella pertussis]